MGGDESPFIQDLEIEHTKEFWAVEDEIPETLRGRHRARHARDTAIDVPAAIVAVSIGAVALAVGLYATPPRDNHKPTQQVEVSTSVGTDSELSGH